MNRGSNMNMNRGTSLIMHHRDDESSANMFGANICMRHRPQIDRWRCGDHQQFTSR